MKLLALVGDRPLDYVTGELDENSTGRIVLLTSDLVIRVELTGDGNSFNRNVDSVVTATSRRGVTKLEVINAREPEGDETWPAGLRVSLTIDGEELELPIPRRLPQHADDVAVVLPTLLGDLVAP